MCWNTPHKSSSSTGISTSETEPEMLKRTLSTSVGISVSSRNSSSLFAESNVIRLEGGYDGVTSSTDSSRDLEKGGNVTTSDSDDLKYY